MDIFNINTFSLQGTSFHIPPFTEKFGENHRLKSVPAGTSRGIFVRLPGVYLIFGWLEDEFLSFLGPGHWAFRPIFRCELAVSVQGGYLFVFLMTVLGKAWTANLYTTHLSKT